jgi:hypothetical protein
MEGGLNIPNKKGIWLFMIGALIGFLLFAAAFMQDTEAIVFSAASSADETLRSMRCPELITGGEIGVVEATVSNHTDKRLFRYVRTYISQGYLTYRHEINKSFYLEPGETRTLTWDVSSDDAAWGYVVLVKVVVFEHGPYPSMVGTCGIVSLDIPFLEGWHWVAMVIVVSLIIMGIGYRRYAKANQPLVWKKRKLANNMKAIMVTVSLAMSTLFLEMWYVELIFFIFTIILMAESTFQFSQS